MKTQRTWPILSLTALMGLAGCSTSRQTAQTAGEMDDLYASSANAVVYEGTRPATQPTERTESRVTTRQRERERYQRNTNPDFAENDEQRGYDPNRDEYYSELSTRNLKRGLSADPGWNNSNYNDGFTDGYYAGMGNPSFNSMRWNPWGMNNGLGFNSGFSLGLGLGSAAWGNPWHSNRFGWGGGSNFWGYDPFWGSGLNSLAYNPWGWGNGFNAWGYDPFWGGGFNRFGGGWGNGWNSWGGGGGWGNTVIVNNTIVTGADPYRSRSVGPRGTASNNRYNDNFTNTPRDPNGAGGRRAYGNSSPAYGNNNTGSTNTGSSDGYYARPRQNSRGGGYYYGNEGSSAPTGNSSRSSAPASTYSNNSGSNGGYYSTPRQNGRGSYTPPSDNSSYSSGNNSGGSRSGYQQQSQPSYQAPQRSSSYESQSRSTYESRPSYQPSQQSSQPSYQSSSPSYSAPSSSGSSSGGGGGSYGGGGGGGSRGPR
ncbi:MAG: hypothetical protein EAZ91_23475 [Cytophagales bacterium]|nr:MAG: hypothetical protein EAZ91_23475 [Cytophagales bacterium]